MSELLQHERGSLNSSRGRWHPVTCVGYTCVRTPTASAVLPLNGKPQLRAYKAYFCLSIHSPVKGLHLYFPHLSIHPLEASMHHLIQYTELCTFCERSNYASSMMLGIKENTFWISTNKVFCLTETQYGFRKELTAKSEKCDYLHILVKHKNTVYAVFMTPLR